MRCAFALLLCACICPAGDLVHLRNGGVLEGKVISAGTREVVLEIGAGRVCLPRESVRLIERGAGRHANRGAVTRRDEWFLVLHRGKLVGWRHFIETDGPRKIEVEERTVFFRPEGGDDVDIRRVEAATPEGRPLEFLLMETFGHDMEVTSGQPGPAGWTVQIVRKDESRTIALRAAPGWRLELTAWSRFLRTAAPGAVRRVRILDPRRLQETELVLRRGEDETVPDAVDPRPWHSLTLASKRRRARALFRPGEGARTVELNGRYLVAQRVTRQRVALARKAFAAPRPLDLEEAMQVPFVHRKKDLTVYHARGGFQLKAPDETWTVKRFDTGAGRLLCMERIGLFASIEVFAFPIAGGGKEREASMRRALRRLRLEVDRVLSTGPVGPLEISGRRGRIVEVKTLHRGERLHCLLAAIPAGERDLVVLQAVPERWWRHAEGDFRALLDSLRVYR